MIIFVANYILTLVIVAVLLYLYYLYIGFCRDIYDLKAFESSLKDDEAEYYNRYSGYAFLPYRVTETLDNIKYNIIYYSSVYNVPEIPDYQTLVYPPKK